MASWKGTWLWRTIHPRWSISLNMKGSKSCITGWRAIRNHLWRSTRMISIMHSQGYWMIVAIQVRDGNQCIECAHLILAFYSADSLPEREGEYQRFIQWLCMQRIHCWDMNSTASDVLSAVYARSKDGQWLLYSTNTANLQIPKCLLIKRWVEIVICDSVLTFVYSLLKRLIMKKYNLIPNISPNGYDPFDLASGNGLKKKYLEIDVDAA